MIPATLQTPWDFSDVKSPNGLWTACYSDLTEFGMGSPLGGRLTIIGQAGQKVEVHDSCGGPACWSPDSMLLAVPVWVERRAWIAVVDAEERTLTGYDYDSAVVHIHSFENGVIRFTDSPAHYPRVRELDTTVFKVNRVLRV